MESILRPVLLFALFLSSLNPALALDVRVGVQDIDTEPAIGIPLAGYGAKERRLPTIDWRGRYPHSFFFKPSEGVRDPIRAKAMIIETESGRYAFVSIDTIGVTADFVKDVSRKILKYNIPQNHLFLTGTHTHSGPGTLSRNLLLNVIAVDLFKRKNYNHILKKVDEVVAMAVANLVPATLYSTSFDAKDIQENKFRRFNDNWFDPKASFLLARSKATGEWLGGMMNFAVHGNAMHIDDMRYSADFPGALERAVQRILTRQNQNHSSLLANSVPPILFMNGAEGDVRNKGDRGEIVMEQTASLFESQAEPFINPILMKEINPVIKTETTRVSLGLPAWPLKVCAKRDGFYRNWMRAIPNRFGPPVYPWFSNKTDLSVFMIDDIVMMTWPGEASTSLGFRLKDQASRNGFANAWVLGLTNDYLAYFTTKPEFLEATYDSCSSMYSWVGGDRILAHYDQVLHRNRK